jgi:hypothetical protein
MQVQFVQALQWWQYIIVYLDVVIMILYYLLDYWHLHLEYLLQWDYKATAFDFYNGFVFFRLQHHSLDALDCSLMDFSAFP